MPGLLSCQEECKLNDLEQSMDNRQRVGEKNDPYVNKLPELVREQKQQIEDLEVVQKRLKKNLIKVIVTAVILGVLLVVTGIFPIRTTIVPWIMGETVIESNVTDSIDAGDAEQSKKTSEEKAGSKTGKDVDVSDQSKGEQPSDHSQTETSVITSFELDGVTYNFPVHSDDLLKNGWQMIGENQDSSNPDLMVQSLYDAAGSSAYLYKTADGTVTQVSVGLATPETTCFGLHQGMNISEVDAVFSNVQNRVSENAESTEGKGVVTYSYSGYSIRVTLINGGVSSVELMLV